MKVFSAALALLASSSAPVFAAESTKLRAQQDDTAARDLAAGGDPGAPGAPVDPFVQLNGEYMGSTSATILGRVLFGGCSKNLADCDGQGGYFEKDVYGVPICEVRCKANTCDEVDITIAVDAPGLMGASVSDVTVTIGAGGRSKDGSACSGGGGGADPFVIGYECFDMTKGGGAASFMCTNLPFLGGGMGDMTGGVLTVKATVSSGGRLNWQAWGSNPDSGEIPGAPSFGELSTQAALLKTGNIMGMKTTGADMEHWCAHTYV